MGHSPSEGLRKFYEKNPETALENGRRINSVRSTKYKIKSCTWCWEEFKAYHGISRSCKDCTPIDRWDYRLKKLYGVGFEWYQEKFLSQHGKCAICGETQKSEGRCLAVDHCHTSFGVRELLCDNCNIALGKMKDSPALLRKAADYLDLHSK